MSASNVDLQRFKLEITLGEGADLQIFAATDTETGRPVVVKRPHPTLITRRQHHDVEERLLRAIGLRQYPFLRRRFLCPTTFIWWSSGARRAAAMASFSALPE